MEHTEDYQAAKRRVEAKMGFYIHLSVYLVVILGLVALNLFSSPRTLWVQWPMLGWGTAVAIHGLMVLLLPNRFAVTEEKIEREMNRGRRRKAVSGRAEES